MMNLQRLRKLKERRLKAGIWGQKGLKGGTWNTRRLGATGGPIDQQERIECILALVEAYGWAFCCLTDLNYGENGVREFEFEKRRWTLIIRGRVGILLNDALTDIWRKEGAKVLVRGRDDVKTTRAVAVEFKRKGLRKGLTITRPP